MENCSRLLHIPYRGQDRLKSAIAALEKKCEDIVQTNASLVDLHEDVTKDNEALTATKNILHDKLVLAEQKDANQQIEYSRLESRMKDMKRKHDEEIKDLKSRAKDLDKENVFQLDKTVLRNKVSLAV